MRDRQRACHPGRSEAQSRDPGHEEGGSRVSQDGSPGMTWMWSLSLTAAVILGFMPRNHSATDQLLDGSSGQARG